MVGPAKRSDSDRTGAVVVKHPWETLGSAGRTMLQMLSRNHAANILRPSRDQRPFYLPRELLQLTTGSGAFNP